MKHIEHNLRAVHRRIMVRVWYSYLLSLVEQSTFIHGFVLGGLIALFGRLTHVAALTGNLLLVPVPALPKHIWDTVTGAISHGEVVTVMVTVCLAFLSGAALVRLRSALIHHHSTEVMA